MRVLFKKKDDILYNLHPFSISIYLFSFLFLILLFKHPLFITMLFLVVAITILETDNLDEWKKYLRFSVPLGAGTLIINILFVKIGGTVIYSGPVFPIIGKIRITLEALLYGAFMGLRLITIISIFCLFTYTVQPDKFMKLFSRFGKKTVLILTIALRLFPLLASDYKRISEVQRIRGFNLKSASWKEKIRNLLTSTSSLVLSGLERSFEMAESMEARGYGSGKRSNYKKELWRNRDAFITIIAIISIVIGLYTAVSGISNYEYYPRLTHYRVEAIVYNGIIGLIMLLPVIMNWWCKLCPALKSKI